ncbi:unnamed protein product, partial [Mesorhabditis spiculigera]
MSGYGTSRLSRKIALSVFFLVEAAAFTLALLALLSPTWQYVYLENGHAEHHHGLWLDCVRFYTFVYGDKGENVQSNWKRELENTPFALFNLPELSCVYKFDYYIDQEDLYDHNHDENRIENDAWQHLFLGKNLTSSLTILFSGHKIATLCAVGVAWAFSFASLLVGICSFCHRTFICASTVLITMAAFFSSVGTTVFYIWANYQENKVFKEEDMEDYEQEFGWAFHFQFIASLLHFIASFLGCFATSLAFRKGRAKLVKIEVVEGEEESPLASNTHLSTTTQPFKRSFSAIYRVDSEALRNWERDYMKNHKSETTNFKRTASVPNLTKKQRKAMQKAQREAARSQDLIFTSTSNILSERTETTGASNTLESRRDLRQSPQFPTAMTPKSIMKKSTQSLAITSQRVEPTYEYLPGPAPSSIALSTFKPQGDSPASSVRYDSVYETLPGDNYEEPNSTLKKRLSNSTIGDDPVRRVDSDAQDHRNR